MTLQSLLVQLEVMTQHYYRSDDSAFVRIQDNLKNQLREMIHHHAGGLALYEQIKNLTPRQRIVYDGVASPQQQYSLLHAMHLHHTLVPHEALDMQQMTKI